MSKKKTDVSEYVTARDAAQILTIKHGRIIKPGYINRVRRIGRIRVSKKFSLYLRADVEAVQLRARNKRKVTNED